jgi:rod shape-determining protein MreB
MHNGKQVVSVGNEAFAMYEKAPANIQIVFPMQHGVISHFEDMQCLLQNLLHEKERSFFGEEYIIAVPTDVTEVERKAFHDLVVHATSHTKHVRMVERAIADAYGMGIDLHQEMGIFLVNLGGETTELSVLSHGGMVLNRLIKIGGVNLDHAIANLVRHNRDFLIGRLTAETLRKRFGIFEQTDEATLKVAGRNLMTGVPEQDEIPISIVRAAMKEPLDECIRSIRVLLDRTPPNIRKAIDRRGIFVTGGLASLRGLPNYLEESLGRKVTTIEHPELSAVFGMRRMIGNKEYKRMTHSVLEKNDRWLK